MEVEKLVTYLREKLKRGVDIIPPPKKDTTAGEKGKEVGGGSGGGGGGEEKKESVDGGEKISKEAKVEVNKMEHHSNHMNSQTHYANIPMSMYNQSHIEQDHGMVMHHQYPITYSNTGHMVQYPHGHGHGYGHGPPLPPPTYLNNIESDQMFSDENPNGCSIM